ncbi:hypothetical protein D3C71_1859110 [compost metagenome]
MHRVAHLCTKALTRDTRGGHQVPVEPCRADRSHLLLDGQMRAQLDHPGRGLARVVLLGPLDQIGRDPPLALGRAFDETSSAQGFEPAHVNVEGGLWIAIPGAPEPVQMIDGVIDAVL